MPDLETSAPSIPPVPSEAQPVSAVPAPPPVPAVPVVPSTAPAPAPKVEHVAQALTETEKLATAQKALDAFNAKIAEPDEVDEPEPAPVETPEEIPTETPEPVAPTQTPEAVAAPAVSTLPAAYVRTALAREWTQEEIQAFYAKDPELALKTFEKMHQSRVSESREWAALGRQQRPASAPQPAPVVQAPPSPLDNLRPVDVKGLIEKFGNDELIEAIAGPVNAAIASLRPIVQQTMQARRMAVAEQTERLGRVVQDFFTSPDMAPYREMYGDGKAPPTPTQLQAMNTTLEYADALVAGANLQHRQISVEDALTLAHEATSGPVREKAIREKLLTQVKTRQAGISLKPTHTGRTQVAGPPKTRSDLERRTAERLRSAFG